MATAEIRKLKAELESNPKILSKKKTTTLYQYSRDYTYRVTTRKSDIKSDAIDISEHKVISYNAKYVYYKQKGVFVPRGKPITWDYLWDINE